MATQYTPNLKLSLPTQGELSGTWGNEINNGITSMVEDAIAGQVTINTWTNNFHNLTTANGAESEARNAILKFTDTNSQITGTLATVQVPSVSKVYFVENATSTPILVKPSAGLGETISVGHSSIIRCDGSKVVFASTPEAGVVTVKDLGAIGNGVVDDTAAFVRAFASGDTIYVPEGTYLLPNWTEVVRTTKLTIKGEGTIKGVGNTDTFIDPRNDIDISGVSIEGFAFVLNNSFSESDASIASIRLHNITIKGCGAGISLERPISNLLVTGCEFRDITANKPIRIGKNSIAAQNTWKNLTITDNTFRNISTVSGTDCNAILAYGKQVVISNNVFEVVGAAGTFETFSGDGSDKTFTVAESGLNEGQCTLYLIINGVDVEQVNTDDATLWTLDGTTLTFTTAPASGTNNIKFYYSGESAAIYTKARFSTVTGNSISGMGKLPNGTTTLNVNQIYGINVKGRGRGDIEKVNGFNVAVTGNTLVGENGVGSGIRIQNDCVNVTGNNVERFRFGINGNTAIHDDTNITGNNIYHCSLYAINVIQSGTNCIIQGNNITGVDVGTGGSVVYEPLMAIKVRAHTDTTNYNISNNAISGCKKGIKIDSTKEAKTAWTASTAFVVGDKVTNNTIDTIFNYECTTAGTSASSGGPTGTGSSITDGTVTWKYLMSPAELSNVLVLNNNLDKVTSNGIEFASCNTITVDNNQYAAEVSNTFIRPVDPNKNVTVRDSRTKALNSGALSTLQSWNTSVINQVVKITATVTARQGDAEYAAYKIVGLFKVVILVIEGVDTPTATQIGSTVSEYVIASSGAASWAGPSFQVYQGDVLLRVRGASAADATQWAFKTEYMSSTGAVI